MEMLAKQDDRRSCLWIHHLLESIIASAERMHFSKAAVSF